jgi:hypothetical protein
LKSKLQWIELQNLVIDPSIQVRTVNPQTVSTYRQAHRSGAEFPPLIVENKTNRIVCGNHRYYVYKSELQPTDTIQCHAVTYPSEVDLIKHAAGDNAQHGLQLSTFDKKRIIVRLKSLGEDYDSISQVLAVPVKKVQELAGMTVVVVGKKKKKKYTRTEPLKRGLEHLQGKTVTEEQYAEHANKDRGVSAVSMASTLIRWIDNGWISNDELTMARMRRLHDVLSGLVCE